LVPLKIVSNVSRFKPALSLNQVLEDLNRGSNSLNSISGKFVKGTVKNLALPSAHVGSLENTFTVPLISL